MHHSDIKVRTFSGTHIKTFLPSIAKLRVEVLRDYPDLYEGDLQQEKRYLRNYLKTEESIAVIVFDGSMVVGAATGLPLKFESKTIQKPFLEHGWDPEKLFYFDESVLLKTYRGRGLGHYFFDYREQHAEHLHKFQKICFLSVDRPEDHPAKPQDYLPLFNFWRKRGYSAHPEIAAKLNWKDIGSAQSSYKPATIWTKELSRHFHLEK